MSLFYKDKQDQAVTLDMLYNMYLWVGADLDPGTRRCSAPSYS